MKFCTKGVSVQKKAEDGILMSLRLKGWSGEKRMKFSCRKCDSLKRGVRLWEN